MGEAKQRRLSDPNYGRVSGGRTQSSPSFQRGLVVRPPFEARAAGGFSIGPVDVQELRLGALYFDRIASPTNNLVHIASDEQDLLANEGLLVRPRIESPGGSITAETLIGLHMLAFDQLERQDPGRWALSQGNRQQLANANAIAVNTGVLVELVKALPLPLHDVPLEEILEFKVGRRAELLRLRAAIDDAHASVIKEENKNTAMIQKAGQIELACVDLIKVSRERWKVFTLADLQTLYGGGVSSGILEAGLHSHLPSVGALLGVAGTALKIVRDFGLRRAATRKNPYWYISQFHSEVLR